MGKVYANQAKVKGIDQNPQNNQVIYQQYLKAFKKGVFNFIKEDVDKYTNETIPRKYFSGGLRDFASVAIGNALTHQFLVDTVMVFNKKDGIPSFMAGKIDHAALAGDTDRAIVALDTDAERYDAAMKSNEMIERSDKGVHLPKEPIIEYASLDEAWDKIRSAGEFRVWSSLVNCEDVPVKTKLTDWGLAKLVEDESDIFTKSELIRDFNSGRIRAVKVGKTVQFVEGLTETRQDLKLGEVLKITTEKYIFEIWVDGERGLIDQFTLDGQRVEGDHRGKGDLKIGKIYIIKTGTIIGNKVDGGGTPVLNIEVHSPKTTGTPIVIRYLGMSPAGITIEVFSPKPVVAPQRASDKTAFAHVEAVDLFSYLNTGDHATVAKDGGIDFNSANLNLQIKRDGRGVPLPLAQQDMAQLSHIQGFIPEIIEIRPAINVPIISELQEKLKSSSV